MTIRVTIIDTAARFGREYCAFCVTEYLRGFNSFAYTDDMPDGDYCELKSAYPSATSDELNDAWHAYADAFNAARELAGISRELI